jgi:hypothetical protein
VFKRRHMDTAPPDPGLAVDPSGADPTADDIAMLGELAALGMRMARRAEMQVEAAGQLDHDQAVVLEIVSRTVRRTIALRQRLFADSRKTPEQLAAERAARAERAERAEQARLLGTRERVKRGLNVLAESGPSDRENLFADLYDRVLDHDIAMASTPEAIGALLLRLCRDVGITPQRETWSKALLAAEISATYAEMQEYDAERAAAEGADWREGVEFSKPPDVETKIGRFTFGPGGMLMHEDPPERPEAEWPPDILERPLPDLLRRRRPPDTG